MNAVMTDLLALEAPAATLAHLDIDSPVGRLRLGRSEGGLCGVWFLDGPEGAPATSPPAPDDDVLRRAQGQLDEYWTGRRRAFELPLAPAGTPFQRRVWQALLRIDFGRTSDYASIADGIASPKAVRAVGGAIGRNPLAIVVPCHRVLGRDGSLTGFSGGLDRKIALLRLEGSWI